MKLPRILEGRSRLALLIYLIGIAQFVAVVFGLEMNRRARSQPQPGMPGGELAGFVAEDLARASEPREALVAEVEHVHVRTGWSIVVHDLDGRVIARAERPASTTEPSRIGSGNVPIVRDGRVIARMEYSFPLHGPSVKPPHDFLVVFTGLVLLVVGVGSLLTARMVTKPLARLTSVARDFGRGRLDARANMNRSDELGEMARAFDDMADRIAHLLRTERELLANVSHELRTPLARIRVALDLANEVEEGGDPRQAALSLQEIAEDLAELERLVDDVLAAARLALDEGTNAGIPIRREPLDPRSLLEKSVAKFTAAHPRRELRVRIDDDLPPMLGDVVLLRRVVDNLLDNAQKYSDKESEPVWLDAHCAIDDGRDGREDRHDEGRASGTRKSLVIEVRDRGIGIALTDLSRLFEPFFRADRSRTRSTGGLGLGLALARRVVDAHGGTIAFTSEVGKGTTARVTLPLDA